MKNSWKAIYEEDPIAYVREKDVWNEKQKRLEAAQAEQQRIKDEELAEQQKQIKEFVEFGNRQLLEKVLNGKILKKLILKR